MKFSKQIVLYAVLLFLAARIMYLLRQPLAPHLTPRDYAEIKEEGILRIITEYSPSGYFISGDTTEGFQYELSRAIAEISGLEVHVLLEMSLMESFKALENNKCDIVAQNIPLTSEIKDHYLFTEPIVLNKQILVQRTAHANGGIEPLRNHLDLAGKTIHVPKDSPALHRLKHLEHEIGDSVYVIEDETCSAEQLIIKVAKGEIDYAVCDRLIAVTLKDKLPEIDLNTDISFTQQQAWVLRKNSPVLADSLNQWIGKARESGLFDEIYKRYYSISH
ncbi:MAG: transporter substrate-binding domain-containing protein [Tannerellaceae bacterium]|jgi:membrane-bound lytic murein transglycosylase MltF|nr:transporter substrate-binding domain-containing protein [Tannerellaceae bacterium]